MPKNSETQHLVKLQEKKLSNGTSHVKISQVNQSSNFIRAVRPIGLTSKSSSQIKVHKELFSLYDQSEQSHTQKMFGIATQRMTLRNDFKKPDLATQTSQSNIDLFNLNLVVRGPGYTQNENRAYSTSKEFRKAVRGSTQLKPIGRNTLGYMKLIKEFVQANNFV